MPTPQIQTYHCICTSLLLSTTHTLSALPRRSGLDSAIILPLPSSPPTTNPLTSSSSSDEQQEQEQEPPFPLPPSGYTLLHNLTPSRAPTLLRCTDGFEKRVLYRCSRCQLVVGYELLNPPQSITQSTTSTTSTTAAGSFTMEVDSKGKSKAAEREAYTGKILYLLPAGIMSTAFMSRSGREGGGGRRIAEESLGIGRGVVAVFE